MKRKAIAAALLAGAAIVTLAGCSHVYNGTVIAKDHEDAYTSIVPIVMSDGKGNVSTTYIPEYEPESWSVQLQSSDGKHREWHDVSSAEYQQVHVGDHLNLSKP